MKLTDIARIRRFNRAVTREVGALESSFLGRGRPLGVARVVWRVGRDGPEGCAVAEVRRYLGLDAGLLSRMLAGLQDEGLVEVLADPDDGRRRIVRPTQAGLLEAEAYDRLSDARAARLLQMPEARRADLLAAMDRVACLLGADEIEVVAVDPGDREARRCLGAYYAELAEILEGGFDVGQSLDPALEEMRPPQGGFWLAMVDGLAVGCCALKGAGEIAEVKRLWVDRAARGLGVASQLMDRVEAEAAALGVRRLRLDTNRALRGAIAMYGRRGYVEIPPYNDEPHADHWFEKVLG